MKFNKTICALVAVLSIGLMGCPSGTTPKSTSKPTNVQSNFPRKNILTVSARDYCDSVGKQLSDYKMVGILGKDITELIPEGTEVIVDYDFDYAGTQSTTWQYESGTALVPKNQ